MMRRLPVVQNTTLDEDSNVDPPAVLDVSESASETVNMVGASTVRNHPHHQEDQEDGDRGIQEEKVQGTTADSTTATTEGDAETELKQSLDNNQEQGYQRGRKRFKKNYPGPFRSASKSHPTKYCCAIGCGRSEFETRFHRVPKVPAPLPADASECRRKTYHAKLTRRRHVLYRLGLGEKDGRKDLRYCVSHDESWTMKAFGWPRPFLASNGDLSSLKEIEIDRPLPPRNREIVVQVKAVAV